MLGALQLGLFTMFWTSLTFRLSAPPFGYSAIVIGLFGLGVWVLGRRGPLVLASTDRAVVSG